MPDRPATTREVGIRHGVVVMLALELHEHFCLTVLR